MSATQNVAAETPSLVPVRPKEEAAGSGAPANGTAPAESPNLERSVGVGAAWKLLGQIGVQGIRLATVAILAHLLTPTDYGAAAIMIALASFAPTVADMGMGSALVQTDRVTQEVRSTVFWASLGFGITLSVLVAGLAGPAGSFLDDPRVGSMVAVGGLTLAVCSAGTAAQAVFMREMRFRDIELRFWLAVLTASAVAVLAAFLGAGPWALALQQVTLLTTFVAALWWRAGWHPTFEFSGAAFRRLGRFAVRIAGGRWARLAELLVLSLLIGKLIGVPALGAWSFAMATVILPLTVIAIPIAEVLFSAFSRLQGDRQRIADLWLQSLRFLAAVVLPVLVGLMVVAPDLIPTVFGGQWRVSVGIIQILCVFVLIRCLQSWSSVVVDAVGRPEITLWTQLGALCLTPVAVVVGAQWSVEAVAGLFVLAQVIAVEIPVLMFVVSELRVSPRTLAGRLGGVMLATLLMAAACVLGRSAMMALGVGMAGRAGLTIALGAVVYAGAIWFIAPDIRDRVLRLGRGALGRASAAGKRLLPQL